MKGSQLNYYRSADDTICIVFVCNARYYKKLKKTYAVLYNTDLIEEDTKKNILKLKERYPGKSD